MSQCFKQSKGLTFQFLGQLGVMALVVVVGPSTALQAEFPGCNFIQPVNHLVFKIFNLIFKDGDLGRELVRGNF
jgi:hypothetical protein